MTTIRRLLALAALAVSLFCAAPARADTPPLPLIPAYISAYESLAFNDYFDIAFGLLPADIGSYYAEGYAFGAYYAINAYSQMGAAAIYGPYANPALPYPLTAGYQASYNAAASINASYAFTFQAWSPGAACQFAYQAGFLEAVADTVGYQYDPPTSLVNQR